MRFKLLISLIFMLALILFPLSIKAAPVPWDSTTYSVSAIIGEHFIDAYDSDVDSGSAPPVSAFASYFGSPALSEMTESTIHMACSVWIGAPRCQTIASFTGNFIANDSLFAFSSSGYMNNLMVENVTASTTLFDQFYSGSDTLFIPIQIGDEISVSFTRDTGEHIYHEGSFDFTDTYSMSVVPEPISSTLFIVGGATLGFRRFRKKLRKQ